MTDQEIARLQTLLALSLQQVHQHRITGELALILKLNNGGVRSVRIKTEEEVTTTQQ